MTAEAIFTDIPTEQTTAVTDVILALMALGAAIYLHRIGQKEPWKAGVWAWAFGLLALAALLGAIVHGLEMSDVTRIRLWRPLYLSLGVTTALFLVGVVYDIWGSTVARRMLPVTIVISLVFFGITLLWPDRFLVFIIYQGVAMVVALGGYGWLAVTGDLEGAWLMVAGILVTMIAAGVQASGAVSFSFIWEFDHNGAYHLIQMVGLALLVAGLRAALLY
jgi:hypothetical protein